ncbi:CDP-diacylglycerol--serine O-phosphatidyltransferase [Vogesella oryzae]|uniref:CDP-diacylglycerol--serine O-phosphatidyltransferase n=1 Tax=Vogesella oryzae TaxID=1735285 RepID=UPI001581CD3F|nr:CDP-diacylglycerol--serine O-phosphatidyltransferase [Vogesella oryzae]
MPFFSRKPDLGTLPGFFMPAGCMQTLHSASEFRQVLLTLIRGAQTRIHLAALYLQQDEAGEEILDALFQAASNNPQLDVRVFVDAHRAQRGLIGQGRKAGNAAWYRSRAQQHPLPNLAIHGVPVQRQELFGVMHLKGFVIDNDVLYSGASLNNVYLHVGERYRFDRYHLFHHPELADSLSHFLLSQLASSPAVLRLDQPLDVDKREQRQQVSQLRNKLSQQQYAAPSARPAGTSIHPIIGLGRGNRFNRLLLQLLQQPQQQLVICTPYFNLPRSVLRQIDALLARNVHVEIISGDKQANDFYIPPDQPFKFIGCLPYLYEINLRRFARKRQSFLQSGQLTLRLWKHDSNSFHLKGAWVDQQYMLITGNNLNPRAFTLDLENGLLIHDPQQALQSQIAEELTSIRRYSTVLSHYRQLQKLHDYPERVRKILGRLGKLRIDRLFYRLL